MSFYILLFTPTLLILLLAVFAWRIQLGIQRFEKPGTQRASCKSRTLRTHKL